MTPTSRPKRTVKAPAGLKRTAQFTLRWPVELEQLIERDAKTSRRSKADVVILVLEAHYRRARRSPPTLKAASV